MAADDYFSPLPDQGYSTDHDSSASPAGNRPASGARRATPGEVLSQGFQGDQNAGDFLGLDVEFTGSQDPNQFGGQGPLDLVPPPGTYSDDGSGYPALAPEPAAHPVGDPVQDYAQAPSAFEFGEDLGSEEGLASFASEKSPSKVPLFLGAFLVAGLVGGAVFFGPGLYSQYFGDSTEVALAPRATPKGAPLAATETSPEVSPTGTKSPEPELASPVEKPPLQVSVESEVPPQKMPIASSTPPRAKPVVEEPIPPVETAGSVSEAVPEGGPRVPLQATLSRPRAVNFPNLDGSAYEWASEDKLELIWRGTEVPLEAVNAPAKTLMPRVGNVRVLTNTGDVFEGRLYAVGEGRVWLDTRPGRIGLDGERVERIEVLPVDPSGAIAALDEQSLVGSKRVRVRVPGGMLYGRVLKADGEDVILVPDGGGRVRVKAEDVQELGSGRAIVVGR